MIAAFRTGLYMKDIGGGLFELVRALHFDSAALDCRVIAPKHYVTDLASVPPYVPGWLVPKLGDYNPAAVIHDAAYDGALRTSDGVPLTLTKAQADALFREGMEARGVNAVQRTAMYLAVKWFGRGKVWR